MTIGSLPLAVGLALLGCGNQAPATISAGGHKTIEGAVTSFHRAIEAGDFRLLEAQFPSLAMLEQHLSCGAERRAAARQDAERLLALKDSRAVRDTSAELVALPEQDITELPVGPFEGTCQVRVPMALAKVRARWSIDGTPRETRLHLARFDGLWYAFDVPGL